MTHLEQAIKDAVEKGGYISGSFRDKFAVMGAIEVYLMDPAFWQALGKARGWENPEVEFQSGWYIRWHRLIDHLASGKSVEDFFSSL